MDLELKGKNAIVTGASYGLGYACAKILCQEGANVVLSSRDAKKIESAAKELADSSNATIQGIACDLTNEQDITRMVTEAQKTLGDIDILVVSTGHPPTYSFSEATDEHWLTGNSLLLRPPIVLTRLLLDSMRKRGFGRIIFIGSIFGLEAEKTSVVQSTLRTGLNALAKCIATEVAADGVTVNVICPGYFYTPLIRTLAAQYAESAGEPVDEIVESWKSYAPSKKFGKPDDLGALVAFLASSRAEFITGTTITIDGGAVKRF